MARVLLLTNSMGASAEVLPALGLLSHQVRVAPAEASALIDTPDFEVLFVDARRDLPGAKSLMRILISTGNAAPIILIATEVVITPNFMEQLCAGKYSPRMLR